MIQDWQAYSVSKEATILQTIDLIDRGGIRIAFVVDEGGHLLGAVTDGDVRRGLLRGVTLQSPVTQVMNKQPIVASTRDTRAQILQKLKSKQIIQIPVLDENRKITRIETLSDLVNLSARENAVVLMAGGLGKRLLPLTESLPKPLIPVGSKPLLEIILDNLVEHGFKNFFLSVNYKAELIEDHFQDGDKWGVNINYIKETQELGTAGALGLLTERPKTPVIVMNGDLLTKINFSQLLDFHIERKASATMCVREYDFQVPYGVVRLNREKIAGIDEKPIHRFFVNAGIYVLEPDVLDFIPKMSRFDMPTLFEKLIAADKKTIAFPIREYWLDVGHMADLERANGEFPEAFK